MHQYTFSLPLLLLLLLLKPTNAILTPPLLARATQQTCPSNSFAISGLDTLCAADSGAVICHRRLDTCCQLRDGKTPYSCPGLGDSHCCGTDTPTCGADPSCKNSNGERDVESAGEPVYPVTAEVVSQTSATRRSAAATEPATQVVALRTVTGEKGPDATGGAGMLRGKAMMGLFALAMAVLG